jgi:peptidoglycan hydrolase-like protein with peptidoglycan-binding domain
MQHCSATNAPTDAAADLPTASAADAPAGRPGPARIRGRARRIRRESGTGGLPRRWLRAGAVGALALALCSPAATAQAANKVTPGNFTGYGFDQCTAPSQSAMGAWLRSSQFWAIGIYISGDSRGCRSQPNLDARWVSTQIADGWRLLPITMGPQASCNPRFPRYRDDVKINPKSAHGYSAARKQGRREASKTVGAAQDLGITSGSTLWYDMEAYHIGNTACRESALAFTSGWTTRLHKLGYVSGVYSSAASGIKALDDERVGPRDGNTLPDRIWIADWDGHADSSSSHVREDGWRPGGRVKQYDGGHNETHGGVTIDIDSDWVHLGKGSTAPAEPSHCGGARLSFPTYPRVTPGATSSRVKAAQCMLKTQGYYDGALDGVFDDPVANAVLAFRRDHGMDANHALGPAAYTALASAGSTRIIKFGAASNMVRRLQRALNAATGAGLSVTGVYSKDTRAAVRGYQRQLGRAATGVVTLALWHRLQQGDL